MTNDHATSRTTTTNELADDNLRAIFNIVFFLGKIFKNKFCNDFFECVLANNKNKQQKIVKVNEIVCFFV